MLRLNKDCVYLLTLFNKPFFIFIILTGRGKSQFEIYQDIIFCQSLVIRNLAMYLPRSHRCPLQEKSPLRILDLTSASVMITVPVSQLMKKQNQGKIAIIILYIRLNMCFGCTKEPSYRDGSFECSKHRFCLEIRKIMFSYALLSKKKLFVAFPWEVNQYWTGRVYDLCVYYKTGTPEGSTESGFTHSYLGACIR